MNEIKELLKELEKLGNFKYLSIIDNNDILENECHQFKITEKTDLEDNSYYLSVDNNLKYCYFYCLCGNVFDTEMLVNDKGEIIFYNSHSNMVNKTEFYVIETITQKKKLIKADLNFRKLHILQSFKPSKDKYKKSEVIYQYSP